MRKRWVALLCLLMLGAGIGAGVGIEWLYIRDAVRARLARCTTATDVRVQKIREKAAAQKWDRLPQPPMPAYGVPLESLYLGPIDIGGYVQIINDLVVLDSEVDRKLRERFFLIVGSSPDAEMQELAASLQSGELAVRFGPLPMPTLATFAAWPLNGDLKDGNQPFEKYQPRIVVSLDFILSLRSAEGARYFQVVLNHEYRHYRQYMETEDEELRRSLLAHVPAKGEVLDERTCRFVWEQELDAYRHSNEKAVLWGVRDDLSSRLGDEAAFKQIVFITVVRSTMMNLPECVAIWAELAGHPHPEAFEP